MEILGLIKPSIKSSTAAEPPAMAPVRLASDDPLNVTVSFASWELNVDAVLFQNSLKITVPNPLNLAPVAKKDAPLVMLIVNGVSPVPPDTFRTI